MNIDVKIINKMLASWIQQYIKNNHTPRLCRIYPRFARLVHIQIAINVLIRSICKEYKSKYYINCVEKTFDKIQHPFMFLKNISEYRYRENSLIHEIRKEHFLNKKINLELWNLISISVYKRLLLNILKDICRKMFITVLFVRVNY